MKDLIRRIYESELDEVTRYIYSYDLKEKYELRDELFEKLEKCLNSKDIQLLEGYSNAVADIANGERYQGFYIGMQLCARLMIELFSDN